MAVLDLLFDIACGVAWLADRRNRLQYRPAPRPVLVRWRFGKETWRRHVDAVWSRDRLRAGRCFAFALTLAFAAWLLGRSEIAPLAQDTMDRLAVALALTGEVATIAILSSAWCQRARLLRANGGVALSLVDACDGDRCRPLHTRHPTTTTVSFVSGPAPVLRFSPGPAAMGSRGSLRIPIPPGHESEAQRFVDRFQAEFHPHP